MKQVIHLSRGAFTPGRDWTRTACGRLIQPCKTIMALNTEIVTCQRCKSTLVFRLTACKEAFSAVLD